MSILARRNISEEPDEIRKFNAHGYLELVTVEGFTIGRSVFEPGWVWTEDIGPVVGTDSCQTYHKGICVSGEMRVRANDGREITFRAGDVFVIEPGHTAWVVGTEPCVTYDTNAAGYAQPAQ